jgi:hypothetical protein
MPISARYLRLPLWTSLRGWSVGRRYDFAAEA